MKLNFFDNSTIPTKLDGKRVKWVSYGNVLGSPDHCEYGFKFWRENNYIRLIVDKDGNEVSRYYFSV